jgi:hypothetical protein
MIEARVDLPLEGRPITTAVGLTTRSYGQGRQLIVYLLGSNKNLSCSAFELRK